MDTTRVTVLMKAIMRGLRDAKSASFGSSGRGTRFWVRGDSSWRRSSSACSAKKSASSDTPVKSTACAPAAVSMACFSGSSLSVSTTTMGASGRSRKVRIASVVGSGTSERLIISRSAERRPICCQICPRRGRVSTRMSGSFSRRRRVACREAGSTASKMRVIMDRFFGRDACRRRPTAISLKRPGRRTGTAGCARKKPEKYCRFPAGRSRAVFFPAWRTQTPASHGPRFTVHEPRARRRERPRFTSHGPRPTSHVPRFTPYAPRSTAHGRRSTVHEPRARRRERPTVHEPRPTSHEPRFTPHVPRARSHDSHPTPHGPRPTVDGPRSTSHVHADVNAPRFTSHVPRPTSHDSHPTSHEPGPTIHTLRPTVHGPRSTVHGQRAT